MTKSLSNRLTLFLITGVYVFFSANIRAQGFQKSYVSGEYVQYVRNYVAQLPDSGFILAGSGYYLYRTDASGNLLWSKKEVEASTYYHQSYTGALLRTLDGGMMIGGSTIYVNPNYVTNHYYMYLVKTDAYGNPVWSNVYGDSNEGGCSGSTGSFVSSLKQTSDSGYIVMGPTNDFGFGCTSGMYLLKIDKNGAQQWSETFAISGGGDIIEATNGGYILVGPGGDMIRLDGSGNVLWAKTINSGGGSAIRQTPGGYYASFGGTLVKTDTGGNVIWAKNYGSSPSITAMDATTDSGCVIIGGTTSYPTLLVKVKSDGTVGLATSYNTTDVGANWVMQTMDQGYGIAGYVDVNNNINESNLYFIKTDPLGNAGCNWATANITPTTAAVTATPFTAVATTRTSEVFTGCTVLTNENTTVNTICNSTSATVNEISLTSNTCTFPLTVNATTIGCSGGTASATVTALGGTGPYTYQWSNGQTNPTATNLNAGGYTVTVTDHSGNSAAATVNITQQTPCNGLPLSSTVTKTDVSCHGLCNGTATAVPSGGTSPYSFLWNTNPVDTAQTVTSLCAASYAVTITDHAGDTASSGITINQPVALASPVLTAAKDTLCAEDTSRLYVTVNTANLVWQSSLNGTNFADLPGITDSIYSSVSSQTTTYRVIASNGSCADTSQPLKVDVNALPVPVVTAPDSIFCSNDSTQVCTQNNLASYLWNTNDTTACISATAAGNYYVSVIDNNGCSAVSNHVSLSVYPVPSVSIIVQGDTLSSYNESGYQWYYNDNPINGATLPFYVATQGGSYSVEVTDSNGCKAFSNEVTVTGISNMSEDKIEVYPNPSLNGNWQLLVDNNLVGARLEIFDDNGRLVVQSEIRNLQSQISLNAAGGVYLLRIYTNTTNITRRLVSFTGRP